MRGTAVVDGFDFGFDFEDWWESRREETLSYRRRTASLWGWTLSIEDEFPHLKGIRSFAKLLQGPGKRIIVKFERSNEAPAYYNPKNRVVAVCCGGEWAEPLRKHEWWAEAMVAHEIGHVRFTPEFINFPAWNLIEDRRIEESMARLFPKLGDKFRQVAEYSLSRYYESTLSRPEELAYPACVAFHWKGAEPDVESLEKLLGKKIAVSKVNGYSVEEFLSDLHYLVQKALELAGRKRGKALEELYNLTVVFQKKYFPADADKDGRLSPLSDMSSEEVREAAATSASALEGPELRPECLADKKMSDTWAEEERERANKAEKFALGKYNSVEDIEEAMRREIIVTTTPQIPSIKRSVVRKFVSFFPQAQRDRTYAEEGSRLDVRRFIRGCDDVFVSPKKTPAPFCIDVVVDGSGSMYVIEMIDRNRAYVRKVLRLLQEAEKISNLRFRVMLTTTRLKKPLFFKEEYEGRWSPAAFCFEPQGDENFSSAVPYLRSKVVLVITDGCFVETRDVETIKELARKKTLIGFYIQGERGYPYEKVEPYMSNFHRFLYIKDEDDLWKVGKALARFVR